MHRPTANRLTALGLVLTLVLLCSACDWTQFMGNAALNGNAVESTINTGNVAELAQIFTIRIPGTPNVPMFTPVVAQNVLYAGTNGGTLMAASADGSTNCAGTPKVCQPLWTASFPGGQVAFTPVVSGNVVYDTFEGGGLTTGELAAFDATGTTNCSGTPKTCRPLWTAPVVAASPPNVSDGRVFVDDVVAGQLEAFDAAGATNCSGSPVVCQPLWSGSVLSVDTPSIAGGRVYVTSVPSSPRAVDVFDEAGSTDCAGTPTVCQPEFTVTVPSASSHVGSVDITNDTGYLIVGTTGGEQLTAFDATGATNCSGTPEVCQPLWTGSVPGSADFVAPPVANGMVYAPTTTGAGVFDATGTTGCSGAPKVCQPLFSASITTGFTEPDDASMVANGLLLTGNDVFDANGTTDCTGVAPARTCAPLWAAPSAIGSLPAMIISNGTLYSPGAASINAYRVPGT